MIGHREQIHRKVLQLLETYRSALRSSKPRQRRGDGPDEVITVYYRLHANVAERSVDSAATAGAARVLEVGAASGGAGHDSRRVVRSRIIGGDRRGPKRERRRTNPPRNY